ncbi:MAG: helix-turn-helix transcriptional regulator [Deltaproteobacteria bacterium]|nr:helix-turn-helix transcriptional regulator [Deltaproteobacteria bacterium]
MSEDDRTKPVPFAAAAAAPAVTSVEIDPVLLVAAELFDRLGYEKVRMEDVAARGRVSKSTLYRRFPQKTALLSGLVDTFGREFALHLAAFTERRHEAAVRRMCADVCGGGRSGLKGTGSIRRCCSRPSSTSAVGTRR